MNNVISPRTSPSRPTKYWPLPKARPRAVTNHRHAAVVTPRMTFSWRIIVPAPRKPIPVSTPAPRRAGSGRQLPPLTAAALSMNSFSDTTIVIAETTQVRIVVRKPAGRPRPERSKPMMKPAPKARPMRSAISEKVKGGIGRQQKAGSKLILFFFEKDVEGRQRAVRAGNVLLHLNLLGVAQLFVRIDFLLKHSQVIAHHDNFVEENFQGNLFVLEPRIGRVESHLAIVPAGPELFHHAIRFLQPEFLNRRLEDLLHELV